MDKIYRFYDRKDNSLDDILEEIYNTLGDRGYIKSDEDLIGRTVAAGRVYNNKKKLIKMQNRRNNLK